MAKFRKTFGKFLQTHLEMYCSKKSSKPGKNSPYRWEIIKEKWPDFDIFIDDNFYIVQKSADFFASNKLLILPGYKTNQKVESPNIQREKHGQRMQKPRICLGNFRRKKQYNLNQKWT